MTTAKPNMRHVYLTWPIALHRRVRADCVDREITLSDWLTEAAQAHLERERRDHRACQDDGVDPPNVRTFGPISSSWVSLEASTWSHEVVVIRFGEPRERFGCVLVLDHGDAVAAQFDLPQLLTQPELADDQALAVAAVRKLHHPRSEDGGTSGR